MLRATYTTAEVMMSATMIVCVFMFLLSFDGLSAVSGPQSVMAIETYMEGFNKLSRTVY